MGFTEDMRGPVRDDQGAKQPIELTIMGARRSVAGIAAELDPPPRRAPIGVYRVANLALATLPGEFTTMLGERIRNHIAGALAPVPDRVVLVGLAGGHVSYMTTPAEYEAQHYEGAQNLFGAATGPLVAHELGVLAASPAAVSASRRYCYDAGKKVRWQPRDNAGPPYEVHDGLGHVVQDHFTRKPTNRFPTFCFRDAVPRLSEIDSGPCQRPIPDVWIETALGAQVEVGGVPQSSPEGLDVVTVLTGVGADQSSGKDATEWCAIWMVPAATPVDQYRFRIEPIVGSAFTSDDFPSGGPAPPAFFQTTNDVALASDRADGAFCGILSFLGLCPEPQTCQAP
jgi:hypothetical protein